MSLGLGEKTLRSFMTLSFIVGAIGRAGLTMKLGLLRSESRGLKEGASASKSNHSKMCRGHVVLEMVTPTMRTIAVVLVQLAIIIYCMS